MSTLKKLILVSLLIIGILAGTLLVINALLVRQTEREVEARLEVIRAAGDPISIADFTTDIPPDEDARAMLKSVQKTSWQIWEINEKSKLDRLRALGIDPESGDYQPEEWSEYVFSEWPPPVDSKVVLNDPIPTIHKAAKAGGWRRIVEPSTSLLDWIDQPDLSPLLKSGAALHLHVAYCLQSGRTGEAVDDVIAKLALTNVFKKGAPTADSHFYVNRMRETAFEEINALLQGHRLNPEDVKRIETALKQNDLAAEREECIKAERVCIITYFRNDVAKRGTWFTRPNDNRDLLEKLDLAQKFIENPESIMNLDRSVQAVEYSFEDSLKSYYDSYLRQCAKYRAVRILTAIRRMDDPESLIRRDATIDPADLDVPAEVATDPYGGKPLIVRKGKNGWFVYSAGENLIDDGGDVLRLPGNDVGFAPVPKKKPWPKMP